MSLESGFWLQYATQRSATLVGLADDLAGDGYRPGVIFVPLGAPRTLRSLYDRDRPRGGAFLDPCGHLIDRVTSTRRATNFPWLDISFGSPNNVASWTDWMETSLEHQLSDDLLDGADEPSIVVTPSPQLAAATGTRELYTIIDSATATRDAYDGEPECWLGLDVDRDYLRNVTRLTELANAVVTAGFPGVVLRCFQLELPPITDRRLLDGLASWSKDALPPTSASLYLDQAGSDGSRPPGVQPLGPAASRKAVG